VKIFLVFVWAAAVAAGMASIWSYSSRPGERAPAPAVMPADIPLQEAGKFKLVLSVHPRCPCSNATVDELSAILARTDSALQVHALIFSPAEADAAWSDSILVQALKKLPHTTLITDVDGLQAERLGARTSGDAHLFAPDGRLVFRGGITAGRGHVGENLGRQTVIDLVLGKTPSTNETPVFGCAIRPKSEGSVQ
jgi:hypothetical protein